SFGFDHDRRIQEKFTTESQRTRRRPRFESLFLLCVLCDSVVQILHFKTSAAGQNFFSALSRAEGGYYTADNRLAVIMLDVQTGADQAGTIAHDAQAHS